MITSDGWHTIDEFTWPVTWKFRLLTPWGLTQSELSVDLPAGADRAGYCGKVGYLVFQAAIVPTMTANTVLLDVETRCWKDLPAYFPGLFVPLLGALGGAAAPRAETPVLTLHSGHLDPWARRRFFLSGAPAVWQNDGLLTQAGQGHVQTVARGLWRGLGGIVDGGPMKWLLARPGHAEEPDSPYDGPTFRPVQYIRAHLFTDKAPANAA